MSGTRWERRAKIVATLGPASSDPATVASVVRTGIDGRSPEFLLRRPRGLGPRCRDGPRSRGSSRPPAGPARRPPGSAYPRGPDEGTPRTWGRDPCGLRPGRGRGRASPDHIRRARRGARAGWPDPHGRWSHRTRSVSDAANALLDGTDAVMLSAETATGRYPVRAVEAVVRVISEIEQSALVAGGPKYDVPLRSRRGEPVATPVAGAAAAWSSPQGSRSMFGARPT
ncbi:MAG: hypothetical protein HY702_00385 [Gemmatimonadetes bacterium]|nr:hypothetical protein [Gemmatimonadota bacterium]